MQETLDVQTGVQGDLIARMNRFTDILHSTSTRREKAIGKGVVSASAAFSRHPLDFVSLVLMINLPREDFQEPALVHLSAAHHWILCREGWQLFMLIKVSIALALRGFTHDLLRVLTPECKA